MQITFNDNLIWLSFKWIMFKIFTIFSPVAPINNPRVDDIQCQIINNRKFIFALSSNTPALSSCLVYAQKFKSKFSWDCASIYFILNDLCMCVCVAENWNAVKFACGTHAVEISQVFHIELLQKYHRHLHPKGKIFALSLPSDCWMALWRRVVVKINQKQHPISVLGCHQHLSVPRVRLVGGLRKHHGREKLPHQKFSIIPLLWRLWKVVTGECGSNESRLKISQFLPSHPRCSLTSNF